MVLKHYSYENTQNLKSSNNSTSKQKLANNRHTNTPNAACIMTLNKNSGNKKGITQITPDHQTVIKPLPY
jgi:hypothetical protein